MKVDKNKLLKYRSLGRNKAVGGWKQLFIEFVDGHSMTLGKGPVKREGLKCMEQKALTLPTRYVAKR